MYLDSEFTRSCFAHVVAVLIHDVDNFRWHIEWLVRIGLSWELGLVYCTQPT